MWPKTGRTHQLRKHASGALGCPILGDGRYTARHSLDDTEGLFLWSMEVALPPSATPWRFGDGETAADDDARKWLRVKVDSDPEKFRARVGM
jgi:23S rRNA-/tRNA-specific pseudouridylate synthase